MFEENNTYINLRFSLFRKEFLLAKQMVYKREINKFRAVAIDWRKTIYRPLSESQLEKLLLHLKHEDNLSV